MKQQVLYNETRSEMRRAGPEYKQVNAMHNSVRRPTNGPCRPTDHGLMMLVSPVPSGAYICRLMMRGQIANAMPAFAPDTRAGL